MKEKINRHLNTVKNIFQRPETFFILILIFTSSSSFLLGKISEQYKNNIQEKNNIKLINQTKIEDVRLVASKKGTKYHLPWCPGAMRMSEKNKIFFKNKYEAEKAGYEPAKNCAGL